MNKDEWMSAALFSAKKIVKRWKRSYSTFTAEQLLREVEKDIGDAHERRWFGATILTLKADRVIARCGYSPAKSSHGSMKPRYQPVWHR